MCHSAHVALNANRVHGSQLWSQRGALSLPKCALLSPVLGPEEWNAVSRLPCNAQGLTDKHTLPTLGGSGRGTEVTCPALLLYRPRAALVLASIRFGYQVLGAFQILCLGGHFRSGYPPRWLEEDETVILGWGNVYGGLGLTCLTSATCQLWDAG